MAHRYVVNLRDLQAHPQEMKLSEKSGTFKVRQAFSPSSSDCQLKLHYDGEDLQPLVSDDLKPAFRNFMHAVKLRSHGNGRSSKSRPVNRPSSGRNLRKNTAESFA